MKWILLLATLLLTLATWFLPSFVMAQGANLPDLVPGTTSTWTRNGITWAGNPFCDVAEHLLSADNEAVDFGSIVNGGYHCPGPGASSRYPRVLIGGWYDSGCSEWYGASPDAGACEFVPPGSFPGAPPTAPGRLRLS